MSSFEGITSDEIVWSGYGVFIYVTTVKKAPYLVDKRDGSGEKAEFKELSKVIAK